MGRRKSRRSWETRDTARRRHARLLAPSHSTSCGKIRYTTLEAAEVAAELKAGTQGPERTYPNELRVYWHQRCRGYHITSKPNQGE